jgi:hypothetical protein
MMLKTTTNIVFKSQASSITLSVAVHMSIIFDLQQQCCTVPHPSLQTSFSQPKSSGAISFPKCPHPKCCEPSRYALFVTHHHPILINTSLFQLCSVATSSTSSDAEVTKVAAAAARAHEPALKRRPAECIASTLYELLSFGILTHIGRLDQLNNLPPVALTFSSAPLFPSLSCQRRFSHGSKFEVSHSRCDGIIFGRCGACCRHQLPHAKCNF